jgi:hypothetical protein
MRLLGSSGLAARCLETLRGHFQTSQKLGIAGFAARRRQCNAMLLIRCGESWPLPLELFKNALLAFTHSSKVVLRPAPDGSADWLAIPRHRPHVKIGYCIRSSPYRRRNYHRHRDSYEISVHFIHYDVRHLNAERDVRDVLSTVKFAPKA